MKNETLRERLLRLKTTPNLLEEEKQELKDLQEIWTDLKNLEAKWEARKWDK